MFSPELAHIILSDPAIQEKLAANVMEVIRARSYQGLDVDFESIYAEDAQSYVSFISRLRSLPRPWASRPCGCSPQVLRQPAGSAL